MPHSFGIFQFKIDDVIEREKIKREKESEKVEAPRNQLIKSNKSNKYERLQFKIDNNINVGFIRPLMHSVIHQFNSIARMLEAKK